MQFRRDGKKRPVKDLCGRIEQSVPHVGPRSQIGSNRSKKRRGLTLMPQALYLTHKLFN
jgi:hypothetical protein